MGDTRKKSRVAVPKRGQIPIGISYNNAYYDEEQTIQPDDDEILQGVIYFKYCVI